jgi:Tol biopolymer transport system component
VSLGDQGVEADGASSPAAISADGRYVAFASTASNLVGGDTNLSSDVFLRDRPHGVTTRVSLAQGGLPANGGSFSPSISADGRLVAFSSDATNLVLGDTNGVADVFVRDVLAGTTRRVSAGTTREQANGRSLHPVLTPDGRFLVFASLATNLVLHDTNGHEDLFVHDLLSEKTQLVSVDSDGLQDTKDSSGPASISADGRRVAFHSFARFSPPDNDRNLDVYVRDLQAGTTELVTISTKGLKANSGGGAPSLSASGDRVVFASSASNLVPEDTNGASDLFLRDLASGTTTRVSLTSRSEQCSGSSSSGLLSADGNFLVFSSDATNLTPGTSVPHVFLRDLESGWTLRLSASSRGTLANDASFAHAISANGRHIVFGSGADNLIRDDQNGAWDLFVSSLGKVRH